MCGRKYWAIFPPHVPQAALREVSGTESPAVWFLEVLPELRKDSSLGLIEFIQHVGETVFLPEGWWHAVLNLDDFNIAVTHNAVLPESLSTIRSRLEESHPEFCAYLTNKQ